MSLLQRDTWVPHTFCRAGPVCPAGGAGNNRSGRCGERTERCQWQRKRSERVAAVKISSVRRKAAQKFWAPQQDHRPLRKRYKRCIGRATARVAPTEGLPIGFRRGRRPRRPASFTRGAVDDRRRAALSPPPDGKIFCPVCPVLFVYRPIFFVNLTNTARGPPGKIYAFV